VVIEAIRNNPDYMRDKGMRKVLSDAFDFIRGTEYEELVYIENDPELLEFRRKNNSIVDTTMETLRMIKEDSVPEQLKPFTNKIELIHAKLPLIHSPEAKMEMLKELNALNQSIHELELEH